MTIFCQIITFAALTALDLLVIALCGVDKEGNAIAFPFCRFGVWGIAVYKLVLFSFIMWCCTRLADLRREDLVVRVLDFGCGATAAAILYAFWGLGLYSPI